MTEFIKIGEKIQVKPNGLDYDLIPGKVYDLKWDNYNDYTYLQENGNLNLPKKLYKFEGDDKFIKRCLTYFNSENSGETTGVLLSGLKGSGKSVLAKRLAKESNLPIIIVDPEYRLCRIEKFFKEVKTPVCIILDEFEKNTFCWPTKDILTFLDGIQSTAKKLVIMTCNKTDDLDENLIDRASRIRYWRTYKMEDNVPFIEALIKDKGLENVEELSNFIKEHMKVISFDNINSFLEEYILFKDECTLDEIFEVLNMTDKSKQ